MQCRLWIAAAQALIPAAHPKAMKQMLLTSSNMDEEGSVSKVGADPSFWYSADSELWLEPAQKHAMIDGIEGRRYIHTNELSFVRIDG